MAQKPVLTDDVQQIAQTNQLGALRTEFDYETRRRLITGVIWEVLGLAALIFSISGHTFGGVMLLGLLCIPYGTYVLIDVYRNSRTRVFLFEQGIITFQADQPHVVRWDQVDTFQEFRKTRYYGGRSFDSRAGSTTYTYKIRRSDGVMFEFGTTLSHVEELGNAMQQDITATLLPRYIDAYKAGNTVTFGPFTISQQGFGAKKYLLPWHEFKGIRSVDGTISVEKVDQWAAWFGTSAKKVPNFSILEALLEKIKYDAI